MKLITVEQSVTLMKVEKRTLTFNSLVDPPVKCCRCYPDSISEDGFCNCCEYDHPTGKRSFEEDPDLQ